MNQHFRVIGLCLATLFTAALTGCSRSSAAAANGDQKKEAAPQVEVTTVKPKRETICRLCSQPAYIAAFEETPLYAKISGYVTEPKVDIGDTVQKDQILAELWVPEMVQELKMKASLIVQAKADRAQAEAAVDTAVAAVATARAKIEEAEAAVKKAAGEYARWKSHFERDERLAAESTIQQKVVEETRNQFQAADAARDEAAAKVKSAKANLQESDAKLTKARADVDAAAAKQAVAEDDYQRLQAVLEYAKIRAPFDGLVSQRNVDTGHFVPASGTSKPLFTVVRIDPVRIFLDVQEPSATSVKPGQRATVRVQALQDEEFEGSVTRLSWTLDPTTRTMRTEIDVPNPDGKLRPGMYAYADIVVAEHADVLSVPASAIIKQGDKTVCCCVADGKVVRKPITVGLNDGTNVEIVSGLDGSEEIVKANAGSVTDGQSVQIKAAVN